MYSTPAPSRGAPSEEKVLRGLSPLRHHPLHTGAMAGIKTSPGRQERERRAHGRDVMLTSAARGGQASQPVEVEEGFHRDRLLLLLLSSFCYYISYSVYSSTPCTIHVLPLYFIVLHYTLHRRVQLIAGEEKPSAIETL